MSQYRQIVRTGKQLMSLRHITRASQQFVFQVASTGAIDRYPAPLWIILRGIII